LHVAFSSRPLATTLGLLYAFYDLLLLERASTLSKGAMFVISLLPTATGFLAYHIGAVNEKRNVSKLLP
jgi:hypothetical protein